MVGDNQNKTRTEEPESQGKTQNLHLLQYYKGTAAPYPYTPIHLWKKGEGSSEEKQFYLEEPRH